MPNFWAGGHQWGNKSRKDEFIAGNFWEHGHDRNATDSAARITWQRFREIEPGDWFAIKGYGGKNQLRIWYIGRVVAKDEANARLALQPLQSPLLYRDTAPAGPNWFDTIVPVKEAEVIHAVFRAYFEAHTFETTMAKNLTIPALPSPNTIFYGPPGTGKTYRAQMLMDSYRTTPTLATKSLTNTELDALRWHEIIALALHSFKKPTSVPDLEKHPYIVYRYSRSSGSTDLNNILWRNLQDHTVESSKTVRTAVRRAPFLFDKDSEKRWFLPNSLPDDIAALAPTKRTSDVGSSQENLEFTTFHQSFSYEDFVEGIRPTLLDDTSEATDLGYTLTDGIFKYAASRAIALAGFLGPLAKFCELTQDERRRRLKDAPRYALFIDEINRGNVSRIFGELITLIEPDKRLGAEHEIIVTLPGSRQRFGVPSNLDIIATMNSADRSVEALDTALRRRFAFVEVRPDPELLKFEFEGGVHAGKLLAAINSRIHRLYDRDHQIGHAYFIDSPRTMAALRQIFAVRILPLLQEYFFGDWTKIGLILGDRWVRTRKGDSVKFARFDHDSADDYEDRVIVELIDPLDEKSCKAEDFRAIYEP